MAAIGNGAPKKPLPEIRQTLLNHFTPPIRYLTVSFSEKRFLKRLFDPFKDAPVVGVAAGYSPSGELVDLVLSVEKLALVVHFGKNGKKECGEIEKGNREDLQRILCRDVGETYAFDIAPLSMVLYHFVGVKMRGVDIQSAFEDPKTSPDRSPSFAIQACLGVSIPQYSKNIGTVFRHATYEEDASKSLQLHELIQRAWISYFLPTFENGGSTFEKACRIALDQLPQTYLNVVCKLSMDSLRLDFLKPTETVHEVTAAPIVASDGEVGDTRGVVDVQSASYKSKFRRSENNVRVNLQRDGHVFSLAATVSDAAGRHGRLQTAVSTVTNDQFTAISAVTLGRDGHTQAEASKAKIILGWLQKKGNLGDSNPWMKNIWLTTSGDLVWPENWNQTTNPRKPSYQQQICDTSVETTPRSSLNTSQQKAVDQMLSDSDSSRLTIIQGPPGTGKTSVISRFVDLAIERGDSGIWLVAQSNVAVKNIAEKLHSIGFHEWKLLVSKDFHFEWHEHLYELLKHNLIRSERFLFISNNEIKNCKVFLCTLSMLSNRAIKKFTRYVPVHTLVVDEASQIEVGDYVSCFNIFKQTLRQVFFIGDDKQLPPYGQEDIGDLQSIFEISHLRNNILFLDTQYRMPPQLGDFISEAVYQGQLQSNPKHPISNDTPAIFFLDIPGIEIQGHGTSYQNLNECKAVVQLAQFLQDHNFSYRFITPYEGQRHLVESTMQDVPDLDWANKCFNVDSFQGNEEDYIIVSLVRTRTLGFLTNLRRTNVMLTRCKRGMFIVTNHSFLQDKGASSLAGKLSQHVGDGAWITLKDLEDGKIVIK